ncbi:MAG: YdcF family protein, partial [Candidatus Uhrbacteria bacterium]|nr:YdcF family protein [Candidatus Uhrbacteria bacterium]
MQAYVICGYGIPKDIESDTNYRTYLNVVFNRIFAGSADQEAIIIPCGGETSCEPPYEGTEAAAIGECIEKMMRREVMGKTTADWRVVREDRSLSTLENLLFANEIVGDAEHTTIFCDETRKERIGLISKKVF